MTKVYKMTLKRNLKYSALIILCMLIAPILCVAFYFAGYGFSPLSKISIITFLITGILWLPGIILHLSYYFKDRGKTIRLTKTGIEITKGNATKQINFRDIVQIEKIDNSCVSRTLWPDYGFVRLIMQDKSVEKITCLTIDPFTLNLELSRKTNCKKEEDCVGIPFLFV